MLVLLCWVAFRAGAQLLPPNQPEQDACGALVICGNGFSSPYSYDGTGVSPDMPTTPCNGGEDNAMWLKLVITSPGVLVFTITPQLTTDDYDFAVINGTGKSCSALSYSDVVRCNFNRNVPVTNNGIVGLSTAPGLPTSVPANTPGQNYVSKIDALAGQTYYIMINNFGVGGTPTSGFSIDFTGSTAVFNDQVPPKFKKINNACFAATEAIVELSEQVRCSSIAADGSDFTLQSSGTVVAAAGINCNANGQGYTEQVRLTFNPPLAPAIYTLKAKTGTDGNTLLDLCNNALALPDSLLFVVYPDNSTTRTIDTSGCNSVTYKGITYQESRVLRDTIRNQAGCDSVYNVVNIRVFREPQQVTELVTACDTVLFRGKYYTENARVVDTFKSVLGCDSLLHVFLIVPQHFELQVTADPPEPVKGDYVIFTVASNARPYTIEAWYPQAVFPLQTVKEQRIFIQNSDTVKVIGTSNIGCIDTAVLYIKADSLIPVFVMPNAFSPNGDGLNDVFEPLFVNKSGYVIKSFRVFNRWGQVVYQAEGTRKASWNGYYHNKDKRADPGTYFYYIRVEFIDGTKELIKGDVTIVP